MPNGAIEYLQATSDPTHLLKDAVCGIQTFVGDGFIVSLKIECNGLMFKGILNLDLSPSSRLAGQEAGRTSHSPEFYSEYWYV